MQPPASLKALSDPIYEVFYGLTEQPFAITTDPRFFYLSASHQSAFTELLNGLRRRESLMMLTGDTGTGKTTLCRAVLDALGERTFSAIILNPYMTGAEVLRIVLRDFGLVSHEDLRRGGLATADVAQLIDTLEGFLRGLVPLGSHAVLVLDEAQSLAPTVLDQVRMLTGLEYKGHKLLQVMLCGQPGLHQMIQADTLLALNERITRRVTLQALPPDEIPGYIQHRLGVAGGTHSVRFDASAMQAIADLSRGLPRRINVLCDRSLQEGRVEGVNVITAALVKRAARAVAGVHEPLAVTSEPKRPGMQTGAPADARPASAPPEPAPAAAAIPVPEPAPPRAAAAPPPEAAPAPPTVPTQPSPMPPPPAQAPRQPPAGVASPVAAAAPQAAHAPAPPAPPLPRPGPVQVRPSPAPGTPAAPDTSVPAAPTAPPSTAAPAAGVTSGPPAASAPAAAQSPWPPMEEAVSAVGTPAEPEFTRELTFGLEEPRDSRRGRKWTIAAAGLLIVATAGYASWSWDVRDASTLIGPLPAAPVPDLGLEGPPGVPPGEQIDQVFQPGFIGLPPPVAVPDPQAPPSQPMIPRPAATTDPFAPR